MSKTMSKTWILRVFLESMFIYKVLQFFIDLLTDHKVKNIRKVFRILYEFFHHQRKTIKPSHLKGLSRGVELLKIPFKKSFQKF